MNNLNFAGTGVLTKFILKRDKFFLPLWILGMALLCLIIPPTFAEMFPTEADRLIMSETMKNPAMIAMCGPCYDFENYSNGAMYTQFMLIWTAILWSVMNIFLVIRHTGKDEEEGRLELIKALPTGRQSNLLSIIVVLVLVNIIMSMIIGFGINAMGVENMGLTGSLIFGFANGVCGLVFASIALVFAQLFPNTRGATGYSLVVLGIFYILRAVGDIGTEALSYISPFGLICRAEAYVNNMWWPIILLLIVSAIFFLLAFKLNSKRDIEQGLIAAKKGRRYASHMLKGSFGLNFRLLRNTLIAWAVTIFILGAAYGSIFGDIESFINSSEVIKKMFMGDPNADMTMQFVDTLMVVMSIIASIAVIMIIFKLRGEEKRGRIDDILARNVSRTRLLGGYVIIAIVLTILLQCLTALGLWSASYTVMDEPMALGEVFKSGLIYVPAMLIFVGLSTALVGIFPKGTIISWLFLGYSFFADYVGGIVDLPNWTNMITPFGQTPSIPTEEFDIVPVGIMCAIAVALLIVGFVGFEKRDILQN